MRQRILGLRRILADGLRGRWQALGAIAEHEGMFSLLPLTEAQVLAARHDHGIYMPASGASTLRVWQRRGRRMSSSASHPSEAGAAWRSPLPMRRQSGRHPAAAPSAL